jgi:beta-phosphoglucomutase family hydrolase
MALGTARPEEREKVGVMAVSDLVAPFRAVLFDLDGVLTPTAAIHRRAWAGLFGEYLAARGVTPPYTETDYFEHIDGKARVQGVADLLASRGLHLPPGDPSDPPDAETVAGLGNRKNLAFTQILAADGVAPFPETVAVVEALAGAGKALAVVSSSRNASDVLDASGLSRYFATVVDGKVALAEGLRGKPAPDTFLYAARQLQVAPGESVVVEDAQSGVAAARAGGFGLVVGVDRGAGAGALTQAGADVVVPDLAALTPGVVSAG